MARNAKAIVVEEMEFPGAAGAVKFIRGPSGNVAGWNHACPCGCGSWSYMGFDPERNTEHATWQITSGSLDDLDHLSLSPSIGIKGPNGETYHWHGYLRNGALEEC